MDTPRIKKITDASFFGEVIQSPLPVVVDFWAPWCYPCRQIAPFLEEFSRHYEHQVKFVSLNVDEHTKVAQEHHIRAVPTLLFFKKGVLVRELRGFQTKEVLQRVILRHME
jgi:thioredoxin 1